MDILIGDEVESDDLDGIDRIGVIDRTGVAHPREKRVGGQNA